MHQIKLFVALESSVESLEREINDWLTQSGANVVKLIGNIAPQTPAYLATKSEQTGRRFHPSDVFLAIVYRKA